MNKSVTQHIRSHLLKLSTLRLATYEDLIKTEWSPKFERYMRNRLIMGALRYSSLNASGKPLYDCVKRMRECLVDYEATANLECLVDVGNLALVEFEEGRHPKRHFKAIDDGKHAEVSNG